MTLTWGVTIGVNPGGTNAGNNYANWDRLIPDMKLMGLTRLRFQYPWKNLEFPQGTYRWSVLDDAVQHCNANNIKIVYTPGNGPPTWALTNPNQQSSSEPFFLADPTLMAGFCQQVVNRYGPGGSSGLIIDGYEMGNENFNIHFDDPNAGYTVSHPSIYTGLYGPNLGTITTANKWQPSRSPLYFENVAVACYPVLKTSGKPVGMTAMWWIQPANPGGIPNTAVSNYYAYLDTLFSAGTLPTYADYLNLHYYPNGDPTVGTTSRITFAAALADVQSVIGKYSSTLKLRVTEFGWQVPQDAATGAIQAQYYSSVIQQAVQSPIVEGLDFFTLNYSVTNNGSTLVIVHEDGSFDYQPAFFVVQNYAGGPIQSGGGGQTAPTPQPPGIEPGLISIQQPNQGTPRGGVAQPRILRMGVNLPRQPLVQVLTQDIDKALAWVIKRW